jgi:2-dehydropantoate 2-reductase
MKFLFFGAGAIGTYVGGSLARTGCDVAFVERPEVAERMRRNGLALTTAGRIPRIPVSMAFSAAADALQAGPFDAAVFAIKSYDTSAAIEPLKSLQGKLPPALCLQNGVENEAALEAAFGAGCVIAGTVTSAVGRSPKGEVVLERKRGVGIAGGHPLCLLILKAFNRAGLNARPFPSASSMKWSKLLTNLIANATSAILGLTPREIYRDPQSFLLEQEMLRECLRVMRAAGISVTDLPGTPVRGLALAVERLPASLARFVLLRAVGGGRGGKMPSLYLDLKSGRGESEVSWLNGAVSRAGRRLGVQTPVNTVLTETLLRLVEGRGQANEYLGNPGKIISLLPTETAARIGLGQSGTRSIP